MQNLSLPEKTRALGGLPVDLMKVFDNWEPPARIKRVALDQRVAVNITETDKMLMMHNIQALSNAGEKVSLSRYVRNRAIQNIDIQEWAKVAEATLRDIVYVNTHMSELESERKQLEYDLEFIESEEDRTVLLGRLYGIDKKMAVLKTNRVPRTVRLQGRLTFQERELVVWRAQRLSLSVSDYLRFVAFDYLPNSVADSHMSLEARQRFYISVLEVAENGFGDPPSLGACPRCVRLTEENVVLREELNKLRNRL